MSVKNAREWVEILAQRKPLQGLSPKAPWDASLSERIMAASFGTGEDADALKSVLLLWNDDLDASHTLSQDIESATGSYVHGIMHRMEGDYRNAEYWFRRAGTHPCYAEIAASTSEEAAAGAQGSAALAKAYVAGGAWDPYAFNRAVEQAVRGGSDAGAIDILERIQHLEMSVVASYCIRACFGGSDA